MQNFLKLENRYSANVFQSKIQTRICEAAMFFFNEFGVYTDAYLPKHANNNQIPFHMVTGTTNDNNTGTDAVRHLSLPS